MNKPIRLYWNESYAPKPLIVESIIQKACDKSLERINLYPGELYDDVVELIASDFNVNLNQVILGHGVEGLIHLISEAYLTKDKTGATFQPSFFVFNNNLARCKSLYIPAHYENKVDLKAFIDSISNTDVFFLASPNKETANYLLNFNEIEAVLKAYKGILIVDECYFGLGQMTVKELLNKYPRLILIRSVAKAEGMAGLRVGFAIASPEIISKLKYLQNDIEYDPFNTFTLNILKDTYHHFPKVWEISRKFFSDFYNQLSGRFPKNKITKTVVTHCYFDIRPSKREQFQVIDYMNKCGYWLAPITPKDNNTRFTVFPGMLALTPPPLEFWGDYLLCLDKALY
jgi:histidinol-phosphate/aromatic aminotransferase/cobyric acid decarboxylase-like protein